MLLSGLLFLGLEVVYLFGPGLLWGAEQPFPKIRWEEMLREAKKDGKLTVLGPPTAEVQPSLTQAFQRAFPDMAVEYQVGSIGTLASRARAELGKKKTSFDVVVGGTAALRNKDLFEPLPPRLALPEANDPAKWRSTKGKGFKWNDREQQYALQTSEWVFGYILVNTKLVDPSSLTSWSDLLKPQWKGKIASHDPRGAGAGGEVASYLLGRFGEKFIVDLFKRQEVVLTRSYAQVADWIAQGKYLIGIAHVPDRIESLKKESVPLKAFSLRDAPGTLTGGFSIVSLFKGAPHPNAAMVFLNWFLTREGQEAYHRPHLYPSLRADVPRDYVPDYSIPKAGLEYLDTYTEDFQDIRGKLAKQVMDLVGR